MKENALLTLTSLLSILLMTFHLADDIAHGIEPGTLSNYTGVLILVVWLYGTLMLAGRRSGYVIMLLGSLLGAGMPVIHMRGAGHGGKIAASSDGLFFIWTVLAVGVTALFSFILSAPGLWSLRRGQPR